MDPLKTSLEGSFSQCSIEDKKFSSLFDLEKGDEQQRGDLYAEIKIESAGYPYAQAAAEAKNLYRNRYGDVKPGEEGQVTFGSSQTYFNGSRFETYIATQGPLPETICDFWEVVWEQKSKIIVNLVNLSEMKGKCAEYYPEQKGMPEEYGDIEVELKSEEKKGCFFLRTFEVKRGEESRTITQLHFIDWPDHGVPDNTDHFLDLIEAFESLEKEEVSMIHCSAGIGRTGTFMLVDTLYNQAKELKKSGKSEEEVRKSLDMKKSLLEMRKTRPSLVQTSSQFEFAFQALNKAIEKLFTSTFFESDPALMEEVKRKDELMRSLIEDKK